MNKNGKYKNQYNKQNQKPKYKHRNSRLTLKLKTETV